MARNLACYSAKERIYDSVVVLLVVLLVVVVNQGVGGWWGKICNTIIELAFEHGVNQP